MNALERRARKQLLLTRIAFERAELRGELASLRESARLPNLLRGALGAGLGGSLFGAARAKAPADWAALAWSLFRRYRVAATVLGAVAPLLPGRRGWRRLVRLGGLAATAYLGWRLGTARKTPR
jgi:hypothetical protein